MAIQAKKAEAANKEKLLRRQLMLEAAQKRAEEKLLRKKKNDRKGQASLGAADARRDISNQ